MATTLTDTDVSQREQRNANLPLTFLWLELTERCNLQCQHCYLSAGPQKPLRSTLDVMRWRAVLADAANLGAVGVQFIGGEISLLPELPALVQEARHLGYGTIEVFSNLTLLRDTLLQCYAEYGVSLATSVYSANAEVHDQITRSPGSHARTIQGIKRALAARVPIRVGVTFGIRDDQLPGETVPFLRALGIRQVSTDRVRGIGRMAQDAGGDVTELCGHCGGSKIMVSGDGTVYPCIMSRAWPIGHITQGLEQVLLGDSHKSFLEQLRRVVAPITCCDPSCNPCNPSCHPSCSPAWCNPDSSPECMPWYALG